MPGGLATDELSALVICYAQQSQRHKQQGNSSSDKTVAGKFPPVLRALSSLYLEAPRLLHFSLFYRIKDYR